MGRQISWAFKSLSDDVYQVKTGRTIVIFPLTIFTSSSFAAISGLLIFEDKIKIRSLNYFADDNNINTI